MLRETSTNTVHLPCRMITLALFNITTIVGLKPTGVPFESSIITKIVLEFSFKKGRLWFLHRGTSWFKWHSESSWTYRFPHLLVVTLCFCSIFIQVTKTFVPISTQMHEKVDVFLSKLILCGFYDSLGLAAIDLKERTNPESLRVGGHVWLL